jgi:glycosyltransferase involved in cell wall biosynthesis
MSAPRVLPRPLTAPDGDALPITVIVPAWNRSTRLASTIASIAAQRRRPAEVIVVDDASNDDTAAVATALGARVIRHDRNRGIAAARNTGLRAATQPWVALLDHDDEWLAGHLAALWQIRGEHPLVSNSALACGDDPAEDRFWGATSRRPVVIRSPAAMIWPVNPIPASAAMVRRDAVLAVGGFRPPDGVDDLDLWVRIVERGSAVISPTVGLIYRVHEGQTSHDVVAMQSGHLVVARAFSERPWWSPRLPERCIGVAAWDRLQLARTRGQRREAVRQACRILRRRDRLVGVVGLWHRRLMLRRRSMTVSRSGEPSLALLPGTREPALGETGAAMRRIVDLRDGGRPVRAMAQLARRPTAEAAVAGRVQGAVVRLLGIHPMAGSRHR